MSTTDPLIIEKSKPTIVEDFIFGALSGLAGKLVEFPFDTVKVRLQTQPLSATGSGLYYKGPWDCIVKAIQNDGVLSLYRGLSAPLIGSMLESSVLFLTYSKAQDFIRFTTDTPKNTELSMPYICLAGSISGLCVSFFLTPIELIKCRLQVQDVLKSKPRISSNTKYPTKISSNVQLQSERNAHSAATIKRQGPLSIVTETLRKDGIFGMYKGHVGTMLREFGGTSAWFGSYEFVCSMFMKANNLKSKDELSIYQLVTAGAVGGMVFNGSLFPADAIKSRQQTIDGSLSFTNTAKALYRSEGVKGFYRGCGITVLRSAPTSGVIFATYELLSRNFSNKSKNN